MKEKFSTSKFFLKVAILIAVLLVTIFASPLILNLNGFKADFENKFSKLLNTNVRIEGDIEYIFNLGPQLRFENIVFDAGESNTLNGNLENLNLNVNPFKLFKKEFSLKKFSIAKGSLSISEVFFKSYILNQSQFKKINFKNIDIKIVNNLSEIEFNNNSGAFLFNPKNLIAAQLKGFFSNSSYNLKYKNNKLEFNIPELKLFLQYKKNINQNNFIEMKFSEKFLFPGFRNIYIRSDIALDNNKLELENAKISSSTYNGAGTIAIIKKESDTIAVEADLRFGRPNFSRIGESKWVSFFNKELFQIALLINGNFKINFQHVFFNQNYFDDLNLDVSFNGGDIILNRIQFISNKNSLDFSGRLIRENNDFLLFFDSSFDTKQLKRLCIKTCKSKPASNNYSMNTRGTLDLKKSKFTIESFFSEKKYNQAQITEINKNLKTIFFGDLAKTFKLKNYLKLF